MTTESIFIDPVYCTIYEPNRLYIVYIKIKNVYLVYIYGQGGVEQKVPSEHLGVVSTYMTTDVQ
jgi:hypothetical protein